MKKIVLSVFWLFFVIMMTFRTFAQTSDAMQKLSFLEGQWRGPARAMIGRGKELNLAQSENVQFKLNKRVLLIEGTGREQDKVVFQALAVAAYDSLNRKYSMKAYTAEGNATDAYLDVKGDNWLEWGFDVQRGKIRYTIKLNEKGQWHEIGEYSPDGQKWYQNFEMTLDKLK
ncbi:hypothetical protein [Larkinella humicola]|uniref:DUF1579 domain-containing protein n=1 Tax=Larkinella humicola TaxID=2607654 RepID=A0A5N1JLN7_9BACT|nr:hypothetical protein [Larkinella humicola]KAA9356357.1 hypothetical protein F0P93_00975 [Larkinella humicola]